MIPLWRAHQECQDHLCHLWVPAGQVGLVVPVDRLQENWTLSVLGGLGDLGLPWGQEGQGVQGAQKRWFLSWPGRILGGPGGLARLPLEGLGGRVGQGWKVLVAHVVQVGLGDLVNPGLG